MLVGKSHAVLGFATSMLKTLSAVCLRQKSCWRLDIKLDVDSTGGLRFVGAMVVVLSAIEDECCWCSLCIVCYNFTTPCAEYVRTLKCNAVASSFARASYADRAAFICIHIRTDTCSTACAGSGSSYEYVMVIRIAVRMPGTFNIGVQYSCS